MERVARTVGDRRTSGDPLRDARILQRTMARLRGAPLVPRGLYRFESHEEAQAWMEEQMAATIVSTRERLRSKTSSSSAAVRVGIDQVEIDGVPIPVASRKLLIQTKQTVRPHDAADVAFLQRLGEHE